MIPSSPRSHENYEENMATRPKNNPLLQCMQEEPRHSDVSVDGQSPLLQRRWEESHHMEELVNEHVPLAQRRQEESWCRNALVVGERRNRSPLWSTIPWSNLNE